MSDDNFYADRANARRGAFRQKLPGGSGQRIRLRPKQESRVMTHDRSKRGFRGEQTFRPHAATDSKEGQPLSCESWAGEKWPR